MQQLKNAALLVFLIFVSHSIFAQVGIGVTNPEYMADIRGKIRLRYDSTNSLFPSIYFNKINNELGANITMSNDSVLSFSPEPFVPFSSNQTAVVMDVKNGFLGLQSEGGQFGRPDLLGPKYPLHVRMTDSIGLFLDRPGSLLSASAGTGTGILAKNGLYYTGAIRFINTSTSSAAMRFYAGASSTIANLNERLTISGSGFIGINQPNPAARLHVVSIDSTIAIMENETALAATIKSEMLLKTGNYYTGILGTRGTSNNQAALYFSTYASNLSGGLLERLTIADNGKVGINKTAPEFRLHVADTDSTLSLFENTNALSTGLKSQILWKTGNYYTAAMGTRGYGVNTASFFIATFSSASSTVQRERLTILDNGNVGIGTNNPTTLLDVNGTFRLRNGASNGAILTSDASGNATWGSLPAAKGFTVNVSTVQAFSGTAYHAIRFLNTEYAQGINFTDSIMTAATAGLYNFSFTMNNVSYTIPGASTGDNVTFRIRTSTGQLRYFIYPVRSVSAGQVYINGTADISLQAGEAAKLEVATSGAGSSITINPALNLFSAHLIR